MKIETIITDEGLRSIERGEDTPVTLMLFQVVPVDDGRIGVLMTEDGWRECLSHVAIGEDRVRQGIARALGERMGFVAKDDANT